METTTKSPFGYKYGQSDVKRSSVTLSELAALRESAQFTDTDAQYLRLAGDILQDQTKEIVSKWRSEIIASVPNLARHSRDLQGNPLPEYLSASNLRFEQWILDHVPLRDIIAFVAVMNRTIRPFLEAGDHSGEVVDAMHAAWQKSLQIQVALWVKVYMELAGTVEGW